MILRDLKISNYKRFDQLALSFEPGLTVIKGPNEAGKSTLQSAIALALFGDPRSGAAAVIERRRWGQDRLFRIEMGFDADGQTFSLEKDFESKTEKLTNVTTGEENTDRHVISDKLSGMLGIATEELFRATACVTQNNVAHIGSKGKQQIGEQLQSVITGGAEDAVAGQVAAQLTAKVAEMRCGLDRPASNPGVIKQTQDEIARLESELVQKKTELSDASNASNTADEVCAELDEKSQRLTAIRILLANAEKRARLCAERDGAAQSEENAQNELDSIHSVRQTIGDQKKAARNFDKLSGMAPDTPQALATVDATIRVQSKAEKDTEEEIGRLTEGAGPSHGALRLLMALSVFCAMAFATLFASQGHYPAALAATASGMLLFMVYQSKSSGVRDAARRMAEAEQRLDRIRKQLNETQAERQLLVEASGCETAEDLRSQWSELSKLRLETAKAESVLSGRLSGRSVEQIEQERKQWSKQRRDAEEALETEDMRSADLAPLDRQQYVLEAERLAAEIGALEKRNDEARATARLTRVEPSDVYALEEKLAAAQERLRRFERLAELYTIAADGIQDAVTQTISGAKGQLETQVGALLSSVTAGRYSKVDVDERSLDFRVYSGDKGELIDADGSELSRGTLDQLYLAARIALVDMICGDAKPPILLDDPFGSFDDERTARAMDILKEISRERQTLLFTCSDRYDARADHIIQLQ